MFSQQLQTFCQQKASHNRKILIFGCGLTDDEKFLEHAFQKVYYSDINPTICHQRAQQEEQAILQLTIKQISRTSFCYFEAYYSRWVLNLLNKKQLKKFLQKQDYGIQNGAIGMHIVWKPINKYEKSTKIQNNHYYYYQENFWQKHSKYLKVVYTLSQQKKRDIQLLLFSI